MMTLPCQLVVCLLFCLLLPRVMADGYPFHAETQEVTVAHVRLPLTTAQEDEVAAIGVVTLNDGQLGWLRKIFPDFPARLSVTSTTFNDNVEGLDANDVYCLWTAPAEVAVTLPKSTEAEGFAFPEPVPDAGPAGLRISPDGKYFYEGKEITQQEAFTLISSTEPSGQDRSFRVTRPPPHRGWETEELNWELEKLFARLVEYGKSQGVMVFPYW